MAARIVKKRDVEVHLTPIEYRLLGVLVANAGRVLTHPFLLREVWGPSHSESTHYLRVYMGNLRQKLEDDSAQPKHIVTETGVGYRLDDARETLAEVLQKAGYETAAVVGSFALDHRFGLAQGFDTYDDAIPVTPVLLSLRAAIVPAT